MVQHRRAGDCLGGDDAMAEREEGRSKWRIQTNVEMREKEAPEESAPRYCKEVLAEMTSHAVTSKVQTTRGVPRHMVDGLQGCRAVAQNKKNVNRNL